MEDAATLNPRLELQAKLHDLLGEMEELGYHHAGGGNRDHFRSGQTVWMLYRLAGLLSDKEAADADSP